MIFIGLVAMRNRMAGLSLQLEEATRTCANLPPVLSVGATEVCIPTRNTEMLLAAVYKSSQIMWSDTDITEPIRFRSESNLAGDLNAKHPVWNSNI
jgi:hypothetical protein